MRHFKHYVGLIITHEEILAIMKPDKAVKVIVGCVLVHKLSKDVL